MKYKSCKHLRHSIGFYRDEVVICCQSQIKTFEYYSLLKNYNGEKIDWKKLTNERIKEIEKLKNNNINKYCDGCIHVKEDFWEEYEPYIDNITISHWTHCNCDCIYCGLDKRPKKKPYKFLPILKEMKKQNILNFDGFLLFGGGEPTCLKEFPDILKFFYKNNIKNVQINSSGITYNREIAKYLSKEGMRLTISPDSSDRQTYLKIKNIDKFEQVWNNIKKYAKAQKDNIYALRTKYILIKNINDTKEQVLNWLLLSKNSGVKIVILEIESNWFAHIQNNIPEHIVNLFNYFEEAAEELGLKVEYYAIGEFIKPLMSKYQNK